MRITGQTQPGPGVTPSGASYVVPIGDTVQKGWDCEAELRVTRDLQLVATVYHGDVNGPTGVQVLSSFRGSWSMFGRWDLRRRNLAFGLRAFSTLGQMVSAAQINIPVAQRAPNGLFEVDPEVMMNCFVDYQPTRQLSFRLMVDNVLDVAMPTGLTNSDRVTPSIPTSLSLLAKYRF